jgi:ABC-type nitrate/sulfonate/bicarbonate transport system ATPase subunit
MSDEPTLHSRRFAHLSPQRAKARRTQALLPVDFEVRENDFVTILGPSGCGKSTLLRIVAGLDFPTTGPVLLDGQPVEGPGADRGMVFQSYTLFPWLTIEQNIRFGLRERGMPEASKKSAATTSSPRWACAASSSTFPSSSRAACSSARPLPARWPTTPRFC